MNEGKQATRERIAMPSSECYMLGAIERNYRRERTAIENENNCEWSKTHVPKYKLLSVRHGANCNSGILSVRKFFSGENFC